ncbi:MAG: hypothetical protein U0V48_19210 [Anaerolineales bacterium]
MKPFKPLFFLASLVLIVGLACGGGADTPTQPPPPPANTQEQQQQPTQEPPQPQATDTEAAPADTPAPSADKFFTEEFDSPLSSAWEVLTVTGSDNADPDKVTVETKDGFLVWNFDSPQVYYYMFYNAFEYEDVTVDVRADNRGKNTNSVSLICRYDPEVGWYEFNIDNGGLYNILYAEVSSNGDIGYNLITNGGSTAIHQGKDVNEYSITCKGESLSLSINGDEVKTINEKNYRLRSGQIGMSVSSFNVLPIIIEMDWLKVTEP